MYLGRVPDFPILVHGLGDFQAKGVWEWDALAWTFLEPVGPLWIGELLLTSLPIQWLPNFRIIK